MGFFSAESSGQFLKVTDWLNLAAGKHRQYKVELPMIQRGFVWKPDQIIHLWDSLLQGMPIGTLMLSEMEMGVPSLPLPGAVEGVSSALTKRNKLGLVDGQQRTLAMLMGWVPFAPGQSRHRLWVDLGDESPPGQLLRLRLTTRNQPFGYRRDDPNGKLSLDHRRCARLAYPASVDCASGDRKAQAYELLEKARPYPAGAAHCLPLDLAEVVNSRLETDVKEWRDKIWSDVKSIEVVDCRRGDSTLRNTWSDMSEESRQDVDRRIGLLADGLDRFLRAEIPLISVDPSFFEVKKVGNAEPPLALLFERVGSKGTSLSNADYVYAVLKHLMPKVHDMVERLYGEGHVASLMLRTDLVMSALRLAATSWEGNDLDSPTKEDFHRMLWPLKGDAQARQYAVKKLLQREGDETLSHYFRVVQENLAYREEGDSGLPRHVFPYLKRSLVQVLLRMAQVGFLRWPIEDAGRSDALRLVLFWTQWVFNERKASLAAFRVIQETVSRGDLSELGRRIYEAIVQDGAGLMMQDPESIKALSLHDSSSDRKKPVDAERPLRGHSRFVTRPNEDERMRQVREFYRYWWRSWNYRHPMLLWLQRAYVHDLPGDPMAGMEDDTPYDFDHILPQAHWGNWGRHAINTRLLDFVAHGDEGAHYIVGNAIGNVRVWDASDNRGDGDASPRIKMHRYEAGRNAWMQKSAIAEEQEKLWEGCSPEEDEQETGESNERKIATKRKHWSLDRAQAFQQVVELRTFDLYERLYQDASFDQWRGAPAEQQA